MRDFMTTAEVCWLLSCSRQMVHAFINQGKLTPVREKNKNIFCRAQVVALNQERQNRREKLRANREKLVEKIKASLAKLEAKLLEASSK